jgi:hypothetical protein
MSSTGPRTSLLTSLSLVWLLNLGSGTLTLTTQARPSRMSSPVISTLAFLASSLSSMYLLMTRVIAARRPVRWVPPSRCGMLLVKHSTFLVVAVVPLHRHLDTDVGALVAHLVAHGVEDVRVQGLLALVDELDEALHAAGEGEVVFLALRSSTRRIFTPLFRKLSSRRRLASTS